MSSIRAEQWIAKQEGMSRVISRIGLIALGIALYAASAQWMFYLPITPVPITGQTMIVFVLASLYGKRLSVVSYVSYVGLGLLGAPIFAGGASGWIVSTPNFGYIVGMGVAAYLMGLFAEHGFLRRKMTTVLALVISTVSIYACGVTGLGLLFGFKLHLFWMGVAPFVIGDTVKILLSFGVVHLLKRVIYTK